MKSVVAGLFGVIFVVGLITSAMVFNRQTDPSLSASDVPNDPPLQVTVQDEVRIWKVYDQTHGCKRWIYFTTGEPSKVWSAP